MSEENTRAVSIYNWIPADPIPVFNQTKDLQGYFQAAKAEHIGIVGFDDELCAWKRLFRLPEKRFVVAELHDHLLSPTCTCFATLIDKQEAVKLMRKHVLCPPEDLLAEFGLIDFTSRPECRDGQAANKGDGKKDAQDGACTMTLSPPARFRRVPVGLLPEAVMVDGIVYRTGPVNSPPGDGYLPADLLAARNVASTHLNMAKRLLTLTAGVTPGDFKELLKDLKEEHRDGATSLQCSQLAFLAHEITCQSGVDVVSAVFDQLTTANQTGRPVIAGPVSEDNAHATAFAAAHQLANEVLRGETLSISGADLDRLQILVDREAWAAADRRVAPLSVLEAAPAGPLMPNADARGKSPVEPEWTTSDSPQRWAKLFGFSVDTLKRRFKDGKIKHKKLTSKSYQIAVDDLPAVHQTKFRKPQIPTAK